MIPTRIQPHRPRPARLPRYTPPFQPHTAQSAYLVDRNWIQVCLMRDSSIELLEPLVEALAGIVMSAPRPVGSPGR